MQPRPGAFPSSVAAYSRTGPHIISSKALRAQRSLHQAPVTGVVAGHRGQRVHSALRDRGQLLARAGFGGDRSVQQANQQRQAATAPERRLHALLRQALAPAGLSAAAQALQRLQCLQVQLRVGRLHRSTPRLGLSWSAH